MGKLLTALLALVGMHSQQSAEPEIGAVDPAALYFSLSTIADDMAPLEPVAGRITAADLVLHEDEWRQIEFYPRHRLAEIQAMMQDLARFEAANRHGDVFRNVFVRTLPSEPVIAGESALLDLAGELDTDVGPAPLLFQGADVLTGRIANGFSLTLEGDVTLFGYRSREGIMVLSANVGPDGNHEALTRAFMQLNGKYRLIVVDWRAHLILLGVASNGQIETWRPD